MVVKLMIICNVFVRKYTRLTQFMLLFYLEPYQKLSGKLRLPCYRYFACAAQAQERCYWSFS